jgi:peptidase M23-like protein
MLALVGLLPALAFGASLQIEPKRLALAQPALVRVCLEPGATVVKAVLLGRGTALLPGKDGCFYGVVAADLQAPRGRHPVRIIADGKQVVAAKIKLYRADRGQRRIKVDSKYLKLSPQVLARYKRDKAQMQAVFKAFTPTRYWAGGFQRPLNSKVVSAFGKRSFVNGHERSPHGGVDFRGAKGTPVPVAADGRVALVLDTYFGGLTILVDHGQGLVTRYMHLSAAGVKKGQMVQKGQIIGKVGASGRVTGPHLDFGVKLSGARVDPLAWIKVSNKLAQRLGDK